MFPTGDRKAVLNEVPRTTGTSSTFDFLTARLGTNTTSRILLVSGFVLCLPADASPARPLQTGARQSPVTAVCTSGPFRFGRRAGPFLPKWFSGSSASGE